MLFDNLQPTIGEQFAAFHASHPDVFDLFRQFASELRDAGKSSYSADAICHRIRWHYAISGKDASGYKINNNYSSYYARLLVAQDPSFDGFFEFRRQRSA